RRQRRDPPHGPPDRSGHLVHSCQQGDSPERLVGHYPSLSLALVHKLIACYLESRAHVDAYVAGCQDEWTRQRAMDPRRIDLATLLQGDCATSSNGFSTTSL